MKTIGRKEHQKRTIAVFAVAVTIMARLTALQASAATTIDIGAVQNAVKAEVASCAITLDAEIGNTNRSPMKSYSADLPEMITLIDYQEKINVAYASDGKVYIQRYNASMARENQLVINQQLPTFGNLTCDNQGNYYIVTGKSDPQKEDLAIMNIAKYDYSGNFVGKCETKSLDTGISNHARDDFYWGTQFPFASGNCQVAYNNGYICVNYARLMFSGHQSNYVVYVNCSDMTRRNVSSVPYVSHSFDQRVIPLSNGNFLMAEHGDAYDRAFTIFDVDTGNDFEYRSGNTFHFREGANRSYGYNETFAQLGGLAETGKSYVLCASSERTFSRDPAPSTTYFGHNGARDLFVQYIKKDFQDTYSQLQQSDYFISGETRTLTGTGKAASETERWLIGDEVDYGVIWLTELDASHYVANPKIVTAEKDNLIILWEERGYTSGYYGQESCVAYYAVLDAYGNVVVDRQRMDGVWLTADQDPVYQNGKVYWASKDTYGARINTLNVNIPDKEAITNFVNRLYTECLGREAEPEGRDSWVNQLCTGRMDGASVGAGFVFSEEYMSKGTTKTQYLQMLYRVFMGRDADPAGLAYWKKEMMHGKTREAVLKGFIDSAEYTGICSAYGIKKGSYAVRGIQDPHAKTGVVTDSIRNYVERIYAKGLGRASDPDGIAYWSSQIANEELDPITTAELFIISAEFEAKQLDNTAYVKVLYETFMGRTYDEAGLNYWVGLLQNGSTRKTVLESFASCPEFQDIIATFNLN